MTIPHDISITRAMRGFIARPNLLCNPGVGGDLFVFDRITDLATWLVDLFPGADPLPAVTPDPIRGPAASAPTEAETDVRQGITKTQHVVLDILEQKQAHEWNGQTLSQMIEIEGCLIIMARSTKDIRTKRTYLIEAAAVLIAAAEYATELLCDDTKGGAA